MRKSLHICALAAGVAAAAVALSGVSKAAVIAPVPGAATTETGNVIPAYYYHGRYYRYRYHGHYYRHHRHGRYY